MSAATARTPFEQRTRGLSSCVTRVVPEEAQNGSRIAGVEPTDAPYTAIGAHMEGRLSSGRVDRPGCGWSAVGFVAPAVPGAPRAEGPA